MRKPGTAPAPSRASLLASPRCHPPRAAPWTRRRARRTPRAASSSPEPAAGGSTSSEGCSRCSHTPLLYIFYAASRAGSAGRSSDCVL